MKDVFRNAVSKKLFSVPSAYLGGSGILYDAILCCNHIFQFPGKMVLDFPIELRHYSDVERVILLVKDKPDENHDI